MQINLNHLTLGERMLLKQLVRGSSAPVTVAQARAHCSPTGKALLIQTVGVTVLSLGLSFLIWPFLAIAVLAPIMVPWGAAKKRKRWEHLLPTHCNDEVLELV